jgi:hypothetical protein
VDLGSFLIGIKVALCLLSKNIGGNDVTSRVFLSLMLFEVMKVSTQYGKAGISALAGNFPYALNTGRFHVCVCV